MNFHYAVTCLYPYMEKWELKPEVPELSEETHTARKYTISFYPNQLAGFIFCPLCLFFLF